MRITQSTLKLYKERFKFSAAHFLIFDDKRAEKLHGHNYRVKIEISIPSKTRENLENGVFIDFGVIKKQMETILEVWDEKVLLPDKHKDFIFREEGPTLHVNFRERYYAFPINEVEKLPITNTSVEELAHLMGTILLKKLTSCGLESLCVEIEETLGQSAQVTVSNK